MDHQQQQSQLKQLIAKGKDQGFLTYSEVNDHLPDTIVEPDQIEDIIRMINDMGIQVFESAPDADDQVISDSAVSTDEDAAEAAAAALASVDSEFGRTTDPVRMYMREMGTVELLTREGELRIAKRIEEGQNQVLCALSTYPDTIIRVLELFDKVESEELRLTDVINGFADRMSKNPPLTHIPSPIGFSLKPVTSAPSMVMAPYRPGGWTPVTVASFPCRPWNEMSPAMSISATPSP